MSTASTIQPLAPPIHHSNTNSNAGVIRRDTETAIQFNRFLVLPQSRQLFANGTPIEIGSRAFDLLIALLNSNGAIVTKDELLAKAWPTTVVNETNLRVQIAQLRRALGTDKSLIKSISGRGYIFTASVTTSQSQTEVQNMGLSTAISKSELANGDKLKPLSSPISAGDIRSTVAVIDDDADIREALQGLLQSVGLCVEVFASAQEFFCKSNPSACSCLVLDVRLPGRSGLDFYDDLVNAQVQLPVIFISGHADIPMSVRAMKAGAFEFLTKPVRHQDLLDAIQLAIQKNNIASSQEPA